MRVICTACGAWHDFPVNADGTLAIDKCVRCGARFAEQHLHVELSPPPYPKEPSLYPSIVPAPRPVDDVSRASWRAVIAASLPEGERLDFKRHEFVPCFRCSTAPGAPALCRGCLANRQTIAELREKLGLR